MGGRWGGIYSKKSEWYLSLDTAESVKAVCVKTTTTTVPDRQNRFMHNQCDYNCGQVGTGIAGLQARSKDQEILEEGGGAGPSLLPRRDHE